MTSCWTSRYEALGFEYLHDALNAALDEDYDDTEGAGDQLRESLEAICLLPDGHEGEHEFTPTSEIVVEFKG